MSSITNIWKIGTDNNGNGTNNNQFYISESTDVEKKLTIQRGTGIVGIGTNTNIFDAEKNIKLDINGSINLSGDIYKNGEIYVSDSTTWIENGEKIYYSSGKVGINTTEIDPNVLLEVNGTIKATNIIANGSQITNLNATNITTGTLDNNILPDVINVSYFEGSGAGITNINPASFNTGNINTIHLPDNITGKTYIGSGANITNLNASNIYIGTLSNDRMPADISVDSLSGDGSGITNLNPLAFSGNINNSQLPADISVTSFSGNGSGITNLNASNITSGKLNNSQLPDIISGKIFSGDGANITNLNASNLSFGKISNSIIPNNLAISGTFTSESLQVNGTTTTINTDIYQTSKLNITNTYNTESSLNINHYSPTTNVLNINHNNVRRFTITNAGNVGIGGIGFPNSSYKLDVEGNINSLGTISSQIVLIRDSINFYKSSTQNILIKIPQTLLSSYTITLPNAGPSANNILKSDSIGNLSWVNNNESPTLENIYSFFDNAEFEKTSNITLKNINSSKILSAFNSDQFELPPIGEPQIIRIKEGLFTSGGNVSITSINDPPSVSVNTLNIVNKQMTDSTEPNIVYNATSLFLQQLAEQQTGLKGWKIVRYSSNGTRFLTDDNLEGTWVYGTNGDYNATNLSQWSIEFSSGGYNQYFFANGPNTSFTYDRWLVLNKPEFEVNSSTYTNGYNQTRTAVMSSINPNTHSVKIATDTQTDRPLIGLTEWTAGDGNLYAEAGYNNNNPSKIGSTTSTMRHYVLVRKSTDTTSYIPQAQIPANLINYQYHTLTFEGTSGYTSTTDGNQRTYNINFPENVVADILIVGGGGAGGGNGQGGGGGGGAVIYYENIDLNGNYTIKVGKGATATNLQNRGDNGYDSLFYRTNDNLQKFVAKGGGGGGSLNSSGYNARDGGSGGGGAGGSASINGASGLLISGNIVNDVSISISSNSYNNTGFTGNRGVDSLNDTGCFGNIGGYEPAGGDDDWGAGGGGAGTIGAPTIQGSVDVAGDGGSGKKFDITGNVSYYGGGGGGGMKPTTDFNTGSRAGYGGLGGGGNGGGGASGTQDSNGFDGTNGTGGGGGGVGAITTANYRGGNGGSGIVIIRYYVVSSITHKYLAFTYTGTTENDTTYQVNFPVNTTCDILIVAGGGGGGQQNAGGGGAGGLVLIQNFTANGTYNINVGKGGNGGINQSRGQQGANTTFTKTDNSVIITANGGGGGGSTGLVGQGDGLKASNGGSGGGGGFIYENGIQTQKSQSQIGIISPTILNQFGEDGGHGGGGTSSYPGGGGGGAGSVGETSSSNQTGQNGGRGIGSVGTFVFSEKFSSSLGHNGWFAGGGGSGGDSNDGYGNGGITLYGGGGKGSGGISTSSTTGMNGINGTGGGGGGWRSPGTTPGGNGGSGIVIIRYEIPRSRTIEDVIACDDNKNYVYQSKSAEFNNIGEKFKCLQSSPSSPLSNITYNLNDREIEAHHIKGEVITGAYQCPPNTRLRISLNILLNNGDISMDRISYVYEIKLYNNNNDIGQLIENNKCRASGPSYTFTNNTPDFKILNLYANIVINNNHSSKINYSYIFNVSADNNTTSSSTNNNTTSSSTNNQIVETFFTNEANEWVSKTYLKDGYDIVGKNDIDKFLKGLANTPIEAANKYITDYDNQLINDDQFLEIDRDCNKFNIKPNECNYIEKINLNKRDFNIAFSTNNINSLFSNSEIPPPQFIPNVPITNVFNISNIKNYITDEQQSEPSMRVPKFIPGGYSLYFQINSN